MQYNQVLMADEGDTITVQVGLGTCTNCGATVFGGGLTDYVATNEWLIRNGELVRVFTLAPDAHSFCMCTGNDRFLIYTGIYPKVIADAT